MGVEIGVLGIASIATTLAGAGISAYSSYQQGKTAEAMADRNASIADNAAKNQAEASAENSKRMREDNQKQLARIRAQMAGSGVLQNTGSSLDTIGSAASDLELRTMDLFRDGEARQTILMNDASIRRWEGSQAAQAGKIGAIGSLIGGLSSAAGTYSDFKKSGVIRTGTV